MPGISIIVPARNPDASLAACLRMLDAQVPAATDIALVDDGSTPAIDPSSTRGLRTPVRLVPLPHNVCRADASNAGTRRHFRCILVFFQSDGVLKP